MSKSDLRSPLAVVRGLGSAKEGTHHFIMQRVTAIALIPLTWWFISSVLKIALNPDPHALMHWFASGLNAAALILMLVALFWHAKIGLQVIIEDYLHCSCLKIAALLANTFIMVAFAVISILAVVKLSTHVPPPPVGGLPAFLSHIVPHQ